MTSEITTLTNSKNPASENELLSLLEAVLSTSLPSGWSVDYVREPVLADSVRPDLIATIRAPDGKSTRLVIEAKRSLEAAQAKDAYEQLDRYLGALRSTGVNACGALVAPYVNLGTRQWLAARGIGFLDATGNIRLSCDQPAMLLERSGAKRNPWPAPHKLQSLKGPAAGAAIRALVDFAPPYGVRELAELAAVSAPTLSRVIDIMEREGAVERKPRGPIQSIDWEASLRRWVVDYSVLESNVTNSFLDPRGMENLLSGLTTVSATYATTGSLAVPQELSLAPVRLALIYAKDISTIASHLSLRRVDSGANVILLEPFDEVTFRRMRNSRTVSAVAYSQVVVDLLTGPGRSPAEGEELLGWMKETEGAWRVPV